MDPAKPFTLPVLNEQLVTDDTFPKEQPFIIAAAV